jgi:hypothetical protein
VSRHSRSGGGTEALRGFSDRGDRIVDRARPLERDALAVLDLHARLAHPVEPATMLGRAGRASRILRYSDAKPQVPQLDGGLSDDVSVSKPTSTTVERRVARIADTASGCATKLKVVFPITGVLGGSRARSVSSVASLRSTPSSTTTAGTSRSLARPANQAACPRAAADCSCSVALIDGWATNPGWASTITRRQSARSSSGIASANHPRYRHQPRPSARVRGVPSRQSSRRTRRRPWGCSWAA